MTAFSRILPPSLWNMPQRWEIYTFLSILGLENQIDMCYTDNVLCTDDTFSKTRIVSLLVLPGTGLYGGYVPIL